MADIEPYFSALFTREAVPVCPTCNVPAVRTDATGAAERAREGARGRDGARHVPRPRRGHRELPRGARLPRRHGLPPPPREGPDARHRRDRALARSLDGGALDVDVVVDRVKLEARDERRLGAAIEDAWRRAEGHASLHLQTTTGYERVPVARGLVCPSCARSFEPPRAGLFSYQSPIGACPACRGFGRTIGIDWDKVFPDAREDARGRRDPPVERQEHHVGAQGPQEVLREGWASQ
ncbi:MAG: hypothetical protein V9G15_06160 [Dermatophilaceae bacterium]